MSLQLQLSSVEAAAAVVFQVLLVNNEWLLMRCLRAAQVHAKGGLRIVPAIARYKVRFLFNKLAFSNYFYVFWPLTGRYVCSRVSLLPPFWLLAWADWSIQIPRILTTVVPQVVQNAHLVSVLQVVPVLNLHLVSVAVTLLDGIYNPPNHH